MSKFKEVQNIATEIIDGTEELLVSMETESLADNKEHLVSISKSPFLTPKLELAYALWWVYERFDVKLVDSEPFTPSIDNCIKLLYVDAARLTYTYEPSPYAKTNDIMTIRCDDDVLGDGEYVSLIRK